MMKKTPKPGRNWMILKETERNRKKQEETRRTGTNCKMQKETVRKSKKQEERGINRNK